MAKDDDDQERPARQQCGACLGEGGNWEGVNGTSDNKGRQWVRCRACGGSGTQ